jgi:DNA polymerase-3 subunit gamma/tau
LYRRYRPQRFSEVLGQDHAVLALRNAVAAKKVGHAYLFSGPRGTGKTSIARILAKALNCQNLSVDGEPDGTCDSCIRIQQGTSLDVHEMDAASNNGVDAMRDLVSRTALGTPGEWKVYIVDEVHMLSTAASNALLKTLEEPPAHVVFVLATTDPQKVLPTIRSRTQHFEFRLLPPELLSTLVHRINNEANLQVPDAALDLVVRRGKGSARDTLSVLDQVAAAGVVDDEHEILDEIVESLCERDTGRALVAIAEGVNNGREPQRIAVDLLEYLRNGFLALMARNLVPLPDAAIARVEDQARRLGAPSLVRAMEGVGAALLDMRDAPETRVTLEVALVRLTKPEFSTDPASLLERIERLEKGAPPQASHPGPTADDRHPGPSRPARAGIQSPTQPLPRPQASAQQPPQQQVPPQEPNAPRPTLGGLRRQAPPQAQAPVAATPAPAPQVDVQPTQQPAGEFPTLDRLVEVWTTTILDSLPPQARSRYRAGHFLNIDNGAAIYAFPNAIHKDRSEEVKNEVELALRNHFGVRVPLRLVVEATTPAPGNDESPTAQATQTVEEEEEIDFSETTEGEKVEVLSPQERLLRAFPGAEEIPTA